MRILLVVALFAVSLFGESLIFQKNFKSAIEQSQLLKKPLMVVVTKDNCKWCDRFIEQTLQTKDVTKILNRDFVLYSGNMQHPNEVPPSLITGGTPTTWFLRGNSVMFEPLMGSVDKNDFLVVLETVKKEYSK